MDNAISQKVLFEIEQIDQLIHDSSPLFDLCRIKEPDFIERCGIALILHSFYSGIENIMLLIIKNRNDGLLNGTKWHKDLLLKAFERSDKEINIFRDELKAPLNEYMQFRHFVRHTYGFQLRWEKMKYLLFDMNTIWEKVKEDIRIYIKNC